VFADVESLAEYLSALFGDRAASARSRG
jgi:hypothetical protein